MASVETESDIARDIATQCSLQDTKAPNETENDKDIDKTAPSEHKDTSQEKEAPKVDEAIKDKDVSEKSASEDKTITVDDLKKLMREIVPEDNLKKLRGRGPKALKAERYAAQGFTTLFVNRDLSMVAPINSHDEVFPGIILGDQSLARNKKQLEKLGVTHILNAAMGPKFNQIDTSEAYYADLKLKFYGIPAQDVMRFKLAPYFRPAADFIHDALNNQGVVAVHCHQGISRSASLVLAYLMIYHRQRLLVAIQTVRSNRPIFPNDGFLKQLIQFDQELFGAEQTDKSSKES